MWLNENCDGIISIVKCYCQFKNKGLSVNLSLFFIFKDSYNTV